MAINRRRKGPSRPGEVIIQPTVDDRLFMDFDRTLKATEVADLLAQAIHDGDLGAQGRLFCSMVDTWPHLAGALEKMEHGVCHADLVFKPAAKQGEEASEQAKKVADQIEAAWRGMLEDPINQHSDGESTLANLATGYYYGHTACEILWVQKSILGQTMWAPESTYHIDPQFYGYPQSQGAGSPERLVLKPDGDMNPTNELEFPKHQFLVAVRKNHIGHPANAAPLRSLVGFWLAANWGLKWLMQYAQIFGIPIRWAEYANGNDKCEVENMLRNIGAAAWGAFPKGAQLNVHQATASAATLPQSVLMEMANKACSIFISGETLTTDVTDSGSRALGDVHASTSHKKLCSVIHYVCRVINSQFIPAFLHWNNIPSELAPKFGQADEEESEDEAKTKAERFKIVLGDIRVPAPKAWVYEQLNIPMAKEGDELFEPAKGQPVDEIKPGEKMRDPKKKEEDHPEAVESARYADASANVLDKLAADVAERVLGIEKKWLAPVIPIFEELLAKAQDDTVSDADFIEALEAVDAKIPGLNLDVEFYEQELVKVLATGMVAGGASSL